MIDKKKHICLFIPLLHTGGAEKVIISIANWLASRDIVVDLVLLRKEGVLLKEVSPDVNIFFLGSKRLLSSPPKLFNYLRLRKPTVLLSATTFVNIVAVFTSWISFSSTRIVVTEHSNIDMSVQDQSKNFSMFFELMIKFLMRFFYKKASNIITVSKGSANSLSKYINIDINKICVIYNPIYTEDMMKLSFSKMNHPWFSCKKTPLVLAVGRLCRAKGFDTLINAFHIVKKSRNARLVILGEGSHREQLETQISNLDLNNDVSLFGQVENPFAYMRNSDLFILSSRWEGFGNVLVEAMACETPIISTNCFYGPSEILEDGKWGKLVEVDNPQELAKGIIEELDKKHQSNLSRAKEFSTDIACESYYSVCFPKR